MPNEMSESENGPNEFPTEEDLPDDPMTPGDISPFTVATDEFVDINEFAIAEWKASATADERIRVVIKRTTQPKPAKEIAQQAAVSENKARTTLNTLTDEGIVRSHRTSSGKTYQRDPDWHLLQQIHRLAHSGSLVDQIQRTKQELAKYHRRYGTEEPEELLISDKKLTTEELEDISHWRTAKREFNYLRAAYRFKQAKELGQSTDTDPSAEKTADKQLFT